MIVNRRTYNVRQGRMEDFVDLLKSEIERVNSPVTQRIYASNIFSLTPHDVLVYEAEFENMEEYQKFWEAWLASMTEEEFAEYGTKWSELSFEGGTNEIWELAYS